MNLLIVIKHVPYVVEKKIPYEVKVAVPQPYEVIKVTISVKFFLDQPKTSFFKLQHVPYPVKEYVKVPVHVPAPYPVEKRVAVPVHGTKSNHYFNLKNSNKIFLR